MKKNLSALQIAAYEKLNIPADNRIILSLDGGGVRGILTLQLLKKIEELAGMPCYAFCDFIAGTSTGAIIAGLMAFGLSAEKIEELYIKFASQVFSKRNLLADRYINPPAYDKRFFRTALKKTLGNITLEQACEKSGADLMITAKDVTDNEETFFTCFINPGTKGTYKNALLRTVIEASMSAPTYFHPLERFIDGGTTTYNNPSLAALLEAICYSGKGKYDVNKVTLLSLGTGKLVKSVKPAAAIDPRWPDVYFWLNYVMDESSQDASTMQTDLFRSGLLNVDYRRFQISLDTEAIRRIPDRDISFLNIKDKLWLRDLTEAELTKIEIDDVSKFGLMKVIGEAMVEYITHGHTKNMFKKDLNDTGTKRDELVTAFENIDHIKYEVSSENWIDEKVIT